jgi:hypothetical protein
VDQAIITLAIILTTATDTPITTDRAITMATTVGVTGTMVGVIGTIMEGTIGIIRNKPSAKKDSR